ncbi:MAG: hypothetical protein N2327_03280 [Caldimicrobium sp.]|nr:hypothetical protein [Caldimicrobium sp.]MDW8093979.1 hypothetical protein [Caldimicrobium sp.]
MRRGREEALVIMGRREGLLRGRRGGGRGSGIEVVGGDYSLGTWCRWMQLCIFGYD